MAGLDPAIHPCIKVGIRWMRGSSPRMTTQQRLRSGDRRATMWETITWIILGLIAGFIGSKIVNKQGSGILLDIALGIVGAIVGGVIFNAFGFAGVTGLNLWSMLVAVIGAVV